MTDLFATDPILAAINQLVEPRQAYQVAGAGTPEEQAAIGPLLDAALDLVIACTKRAYR